MELVNHFIVNLTTPEASSNLTAPAQQPIIIIFVLSFHFMLGLFTHSCVIWIIIRGTANGLASEFFNLNLSVFEDVLSLNSFLTLLTITRFPSLTTFLNFLQGLGITGRPLFQCLICVERYLAVVHPVTFLKFKHIRYKVICCTAAWIITLGSCLFLFISFSDIAKIWFYTLKILFCLSIQMFFLVAVLRALKQSGPGDRQNKNPIKRRAFNLILLNTVSLSFTYIPTTIAGFNMVLTKEDIPGIYMSSQICSILAGFLQAVLFLHRTGKLSIISLKRHCC